MNTRKFKRAQARKGPSLTRGFRVPRETAMALWLWACNVNALPREFEQLLPGQAAAKIGETRQHFENNPEHAIVVGALLLGCKFESDDVAAARAVVKAAMMADYEKSVLS